MSTMTAKNVKSFSFFRFSERCFGGNHIILCFKNLLQNRSFDCYSTIVKSLMNSFTDKENDLDIALIDSDG